MEQQNRYRDEEIEFMDYVRLILKKKWLILATLLLVVTTTALFNLLMPKIYKVDTALEIGIIEGQPLEPQLQVAEKINNGIYGELPGIKASNPDWTNLIGIEAMSKNPQRTKEAMQVIEELIIAEHNNKIDLQKIIIEKEIEKLQGNINYLISQGQQEVAPLQLEINNLQRQKEMIQPTKIVKEPSISEKPLKPKILLNIIIAAILGIFLGVLLAFFKEWWDKNKGKIQSKG